MNDENIISHLYQNKYSGQWVTQSNAEHSEGVAALAAQFASEFGMASWGRVLGLLHDKGKERHAFQQYIRKASGYDPTVKAVAEHSHAYVGALFARKYCGGKSADGFLANPIASHHRGLYDYDELEAVLAEKEIPKEVASNFEKPQLGHPPFKPQAADFHHLYRMLYSCLVDADYLDTERFMDAEAARQRGGKASLNDLLPTLDAYLLRLRSETKETEVNKIRNQVQRWCQEASAMEVGFYSLTVPTGGGKTLASLLWAMHHAVRHGMKRIIIAIPYTSIIVQTAATLKAIFGEENVLEHHSNVNPEDIKDERSRQQMRLAMENWDYPIIVTTNVRLFESMFSNKPSSCRKLHNIVNSVVILDEAQTLPTAHLQPIVDALKSYNRLFGVSVLFTTASQPVLSGVIEGCNPTAKFEGMGNIEEIIPEEARLHERLRRVQLHIDDTPMTYDEMAACLCRHKRVLCIVNTREDARELFRRLPMEGTALHLSRMMCPDHVDATIQQVKEALADNGNEIVRVVATQLVEAGVDIDFPVVYRQEAGLDSVLQAAGRCNREGRLGLCTTYVFSLAKEHPLPAGTISDANAARRNLVGVADWFAPDSMNRYFGQLYSRCKTFDKKDMKALLYKPGEVAFETASKAFQLIEDSGTTVVVCWKDSMELVERLKRDDPSYPLMKRLARYSVNVNNTDFKALQKVGVVEEILENVFVVNYQSQYDERLGLLTQNLWEEETLMI